jgi:hypothetical protein
MISVVVLVEQGAVAPEPVVYAAARARPVGVGRGAARGAGRGVVVAAAAGRVVVVAEVGEEFGSAATGGLGVAACRLDPASDDGLAAPAGRLHLGRGVGRQHVAADRVRVDRHDADFAQLGCIERLRGRAAPSAACYGRWQ